MPRNTHTPTFSFEFFPPKTGEGIANLAETSKKLAAVKPRFFSVTFGAGGSTRDHTFETVVSLQENSGIETAPHLSCICSTRENIRDMLNAYRASGINHIVALRGDMPSGMVEAGEFRYANELITISARKQAITFISRLRHTRNTIRRQAALTGIFRISNAR